MMKSMVKTRIGVRDLNMAMVCFTVTTDIAKDVINMRSKR
jgi:hypothetical protein